MKIIVLGCGLVGAPIAEDLAKDNEFTVAVADINNNNLLKIRNNNINKICLDLSDTETVTSLVRNYDYVINAVPGFMGYRTLQAVIHAGKNTVDIAFSPEDPAPLNKSAIENDITVITDCGVAPGMCNILIGYAHHQLDKTDTAITYVGGLPVKRDSPWEYKAVFSPSDVIEEYTRPARIIENHELIIKPALSEPELLDFPIAGALEAFNSDGIRSLANTIKAKNIKEKTLRYPGHIEKIKLLRDTGFFSKEEIEINGCKIKPLDLTAKILFPEWKLNPGDEDYTIMKIIVTGEKDKKKMLYEWNLFDIFDKDTSTHSMARTTGYTATSALRMIIKGLYTKKGVIYPEYIGENSECVKYLLSELAKRNVIYNEIIKYQ